MRAAITSIWFSSMFSSTIAPGTSAQQRDDRWKFNLEVCMNGGAGCNYTVLTHEERAEAIRREEEQALSATRWDTRQRVRSPLILAIIPGKTLAMGRAAEVGRLIGVPAGDSIDEAWFGSGCDGAGDFYAFTHPPLWTPRRLRQFSLPVWPAGAFSFEQSPLQRLIHSGFASAVARCGAQGTFAVDGITN